MQRFADQAVAFSLVLLVRSFVFGSGRGPTIGPTVKDGRVLALAAWYSMVFGFWGTGVCARCVGHLQTKSQPASWSNHA